MFWFTCLYANFRGTSTFLILPKKYLNIANVGTDQTLTNFRLNVNIGWNQSPEYEDGIKYAHDEVTFRNRSGDTLHIPQAERYSTRDWLHNLKTIRTSRLLKRIRGVIIFNTLWSITVFVLHLYFRFNTPGSKAHSLLGSALGLLLVFRTNTAYNRFWEGRKIWEKLLNHVRDMARLTVRAACQEYG